MAIVLFHDLDLTIIFSFTYLFFRSEKCLAVCRTGKPFGRFTVDSDRTNYFVVVLFYHLDPANCLVVVDPTNRFAVVEPSNRLAFLPLI